MGVRNIKIGFILILLLSGNSAFSQVGIGIASPNGSAMLDVTSTTKGFLPPRLTTAERATLKTELLTTPDVKENGMLVFDTTLTTYYYWNGIDWQVLANAQDVVDKTNDQTDIAGNKTFTGTLTPAGRLMLPMGELNYYNYDGTDPEPYTLNVGAVSTGASGNDGMVAINPIVVQSPSTLANTVNFVNDRFTLDGSGNPTTTVTNSKLVYTSGDTQNPFVGRYFHIALSFSFSSVQGNTGSTFVFGVSKHDISLGTNGVEDSSKQFVTVGNAGTHQSSALHVLLWLDDGDEIGFSIGQLGDSGDVVIKSFNFVAIGM